MTEYRTYEIPTLEEVPIYIDDSPFLEPVVKESKYIINSYYDTGVYTYIVINLYHNWRVVFNCKYELDSMQINKIAWSIVSQGYFKTFKIYENEYCNNFTNGLIVTIS